MKIEELPLSLRAAITFIPCIFIAFFDPLLAFCLFIVLFEKCIIAIFPMPGVELTTFHISPCSEIRTYYSAFLCYTHTWCCGKHIAISFLEGISQTR